YTTLFRSMEPTRSCPTRRSAPSSSESHCPIPTMPFSLISCYRTSGNTYESRINVSDQIAWVFQANVQTNNYASARPIGYAPRATHVGYRYEALVATPRSAQTEKAERIDERRCRLHVNFWIQLERDETVRADTIPLPDFMARVMW